MIEQPGASRRKCFVRWSCRLAGLSLVLGAGLAHAGELSHDLGRRLAQGYISPAMAHFQQSAESLHAGLQAWCHAPSTAGAKQINEGFKDLVGAWSGIEFLRFGPLVAANRFERINFWPDPRGMTLRQVQGLLAGPAIPDVAALAEHSVAVQGLPALEYVLYKEQGLLGSEKGPSFDAACAYATSIGANLGALGRELAGAWGLNGDYAQKFSQPSASNPLYRNSQEIAGEAIKALSTGLQFARDVKLLPVLGVSIEQARYKRAPFWRSGLSAFSMAATAEGMRRFYQAGGFVYGEDAWLDEALQNEMLRIRENFQNMQGDIEQILATPEGYRQLVLAALLIKNTKSLIDENAAPALGVRIGFNALDGD